MNDGVESEIASLRGRRVLVVGDLILDRYVTGDVPRVSPEAPVPVLEVRGEERRPGGAANVAANVASLQGRPSLAGVCGRDPAGSELRACIKASGVALAGVRTDPARPTVEKTRIVARHQQMLRVDRERRLPLAAGVESALVRFIGAQRGVDCVLLSDYAKGVLTERVIAAACKLGAEVIVDPKATDFRRYRGAHGVTPNALEAQAATGIATDSLEGCRSAANRLIETAGLRFVVITRGSQGIYWREAGGAEGEAPARARSVFDVTGAGDTVIGVLGLARAAGLPLPRAVALANAAAGVVVEKLGAATVSPAELAAALSHDSSSAPKVTTLEGASALARRMQAEGRRIALTNGCFDLLHPGHVRSLELARSHADALFVAVNDDASVRRAKGRGRPVQGVADRMRVLAALGCVDAVFPFAEDTPERVVSAIGPDVLLKGADWKDKGVVGRDFVERRGGSVVLAPLERGHSTSAIIERIRGARARGAPARDDSERGP